MKLDVPLDSDPEISEILQAYEEVLEATVLPDPTLPSEVPIQDVEYDSYGCPLLPSDLTEVPSQMLGRYYQAFEAWHDYVNSLFTAADVEKSILKECLEAVKSKLQQVFLDRGMSSTQYKSDIRYIKLNARYLGASTRMKQFEGLKTQCSRTAKLISREVTRRGDEMGLHGTNPGGRFSDVDDPFYK